MMASDLAQQIVQLVGEHGDLPVFYDCDGALMELQSVRLFAEPCIDEPILLTAPHPD
jgi:hypothetical protein